ncbi:prepilin-type N-terminal cleavage/methylation domain-containing protein [Phycisphaeraceae bacterium D3-23]
MKNTAMHLISPKNARPGEGDRAGFTLIELLVVISIIALLIGILLPALGKARQSARAAQDLASLKQMETAHQAYMTDNKGYFVNAGLPHGVAPTNPQIAWVASLREYYQTELILRSPLDESPHWPGGEPVPNTPGDVFRQTSYGINSFLTDVKLNGTNPLGGPAWDRIDRVLSERSPTELVHFLPMATEGEFAGADHPHPEEWDLFGTGGAVVADLAGRQVELHAVRGPARDFGGVANWGFLDGHASASTFGTIYLSESKNRFDPEAGPTD